MKKKIFKVLHGMEDSWWYLGRKKIVEKVLKKTIKNTVDNKIVDFGSGYGGMHSLLNNFGTVSAYEPDNAAAESCMKRGYSNVFNTMEEALAPNSNLSLVAAFDVVEHIEDDVDFIIHAHQALKTGGQIIITVPAYQWLWNIHDVEHKHYRRYTITQLTKLLCQSGFKINYISYWNTTLFLPASVTRFLGFSGVGVFKLPKIFDRILYFLIVFESILITNVRLPFGLSIVAMAEKL